MEEIFDSIGPFGRFQKLALISAGVATSLTALTIYSTVFSSADPGLICTKRNDSDRNILNSTSMSKCEMWKTVKESYRLNKTPEYECHFDTKYYNITMVTEWELICDRAFMTGLTQTIYMVGMMCGLFIGFFSDKYGRQRSSLVVAALIVLLLTVSEVLKMSVFKIPVDILYAIHCVIQFFLGALAKAIYTIFYILLLELTTAKHNTIVSSVYLYIYVGGELIVLGIAYFFRDWHVMNWFMVGYSFVFLFIIWAFIPESPRYLISTGQHEKATVLLRKIARFNGKDDSNSIFADSIEFKKIIDMELEPTTNRVADESLKNEANSSSVGLRSLWAPKQNLIKTCLFIYIWFALSLIYYGVSLGKSITFINFHYIILYDVLLSFLFLSNEDFNRK